MKTLQNVGEVRQLLLRISGGNDVIRTPVLRSCLRSSEELTSYEYKVIVDRWPDPDIIVILEKFPKIRSIQYSVYTGSQGHSDLIAVLQGILGQDYQVEYPRWRYEDAAYPSTLFGLSTDLLPLVKLALSEKGIDSGHYSTVMCDTYVLPETVGLDSPVELPAGYTSSTLSETDVTQIYLHLEKTWPICAKTLRFMVRNLPSIAVRDPLGQLAGYELQYSHGAMGILYVAPAHRRQGIGRYVVQESVRKLLLQGKTATCSIQQTDSAQFHVNLGFQKLYSGQFYIFFRH